MSLLVTDFAKKNILLNKDDYNIIYIFKYYIYIYIQHYI